LVALISVELVTIGVPFLISGLDCVTDFWVIIEGWFELSTLARSLLLHPIKMRAITKIINFMNHTTPFLF
jgi:hypothetical protein